LFVPRSIAANTGARDRWPGCAPRGASAHPCFDILKRSGDSASAPRKSVQSPFMLAILTALETLFRLDFTLFAGKTAPVKTQAWRTYSCARRQRLFRALSLLPYQSERQEEPEEGGRTMREAKFSLGQVVRHKLFPFRGVVFDVDPEFSNTEEWLNAIPEPVRPNRDQPFYHLFAENAESTYVAYVSEQNLMADDSGEPVEHPQIELLFDETDEGGYKLRPESLN
jgi:heat shock protein HspQ